MLFVLNEIFFKNINFCFIKPVSFYGRFRFIKTVNGKKDSWKMNLFPFALGIPSLGQLNNDKPLKGLSIAYLKGYWYNEFLDAKNDERISNRNRAFWWFVFLTFYSVIDAYIDPEMESFPIMEEENNKKKEVE